MLTGELEKVRIRLEADAPNTKPGQGMGREYLGADRASCPGR